jgi:two-component system, OmpR family, sensor histidine kinase KdpD
MALATRPTPEQLLRQVQAQDEYERTGHLKVFLGYASGVGKSYQMLDEGRRRRKRGQDVVVGAIQPEISPEVARVLAHLEIIPLKTISDTPVMDVDAILRRRPQICLVDGLAYDNPAASPNAHRWQDVEQLLAAGISVVTTINLQYVEERRAEVESILGKRVDVSVPEAFLRSADEIVVVDAPAEFSLARSHEAGPQCDASKEQQKLSQLRETALLLAADVVDHQLESYLERNGATPLWSTQERILVCISPKVNAERMIRRAQLVRDRFHGELFVVYVGQDNLSPDDRVALERNLAVAQREGIPIELLDAEEPVAAIIDFARKHGISQIFIGHSLSGGWRARLTRTTVDRLIRAAEGIDVKLFPH